MEKTPKTKKRRLIKKSDKEQQTQQIGSTKTPKTEKTPEEQEQEQERPPNPISESGSDSDSDSDSLPKLLEPYSKEQLIDLISSAALELPSLFHHICSVADHEVSHRKIFVHGLGWDTTRQTLNSAFESFGEIEDCNVVTDKATGKAKGYGFVLFKTRKAATKALKNPKKKISNRIASCQLASVGPTASPQSQDTSTRKIYVSNVAHDTDAEKLRQFFAKFGEIETGPIGFDMNTGKSRGFALFVYKSDAAAKKVLEEPYKLFEGHQLHCKAASEGKGKNPVQTQPPHGHGQGQVQTQPPMLAAAAAAQNFALFGQHPGLNPLYNGLIANPGAGYLANAGSVNPAFMAGMFNQGVIPTSQVAQVGSGVGGYGAGNQSVLGAYGGSGTNLQHVYPNAHAGLARPQGAGGTISGYPYMCFNSH